MIIFTNIIGYTRALFISIVFLPQTYKLLKTKNTKGLSLIRYLIYHFGLTLFIIYGSFTQNYPLLITNIFGWIVNTYLLFLICYNLYQMNYKNNANNKIKMEKKNATH
ncbi:MAG: SemiSWEET family sugar transporter [Spiroplasma sp.]